ncbi:cyclophilin-like fold protein [Paraburkholderia dilworthii]|uniref:cyclophilin-like fold protein n=1 Tax=Paraburkholderia dilworthii TaxID=948106 RepID=UPI003898E467
MCRVCSKRLTPPRARDAIAATTAPCTSSATENAKGARAAAAVKEHASERRAHGGDKRAPDGFDPSEGTVAYYAPWGNIALFYKELSAIRNRSSISAPSSHAWTPLRRRRNSMPLIERVND